MSQKIETVVVSGAEKEFEKKLNELMVKEDSYVMATNMTSVMLGTSLRHTVVLQRFVPEEGVPVIGKA